MIQEVSRNSGIGQDKEFARDTKSDLDLLFRLLSVKYVEVVGLLKTGSKAGQMVVLALDQVRDLESFGLDMGDVGFHSWAGTILACCTYHENSMKEGELDH